MLDDIRNAIKALAVDKEQGMRIFEEELQKILNSIDRSGRVSYFKQLKQSAEVLSKIKLTTPISEAKYIGVIGEIFVRRDHFSLMSIPEKLAHHGFVMLDAPIMKWIRYTDFLRKIKMFQAKTKVMVKIEQIITELFQNFFEKKIKKILAKSNLYEVELLRIEKYMNHSKHFIPWTLTGEPGLSSGAALYYLVKKQCGVINIGPFGCMNSRMTEAISTPEMTLKGKLEASKEAGEKIDLSYLKDNTDNLPFLSIESDGNPMSQLLEAKLEIFMLQADRLHKKMKG